MNRYDTLILGDDREGIELALEQARDGRRVGIVSPIDGSFPRHLIREAAERIASRPICDMNAWRDEAGRLLHEQFANDELDFLCWGIDRFHGQARFVSPGAVQIQAEDGSCETVTASEFVLAQGTRTHAPNFLRVDHRSIIDEESLLSMTSVPRSVVVVGAGESGLSTAAMLAKLGSEVTVIDDGLTVAELYGTFNPVLEVAQSLNVAFRLDDEVIGSIIRPDGRVAVCTASGQSFEADRLVICVGREGCTEGFELDAAGVGVDERGRIWCDEAGRTWNNSIRAVGSVVGYGRQLRVNDKVPTRNRVRSMRVAEAVI